MKNLCPKEMKERAKIWVTYLLKILFRPLRLCRIRQNRVMFVSLTGGAYVEYSCNTKYIYERLRESGGADCEIVWAFHYPKQYDFLKNQGVRMVKHFSLRAFYYLMTSKVVVTGGSYVPWVPFKEQQTVINTWHGGGAYKRLDNGEGGQKEAIKKRNEMTGKNTTVFVTSSRAFTEHVIHGAFSFQGTILEVGMPRNDMLVNGEIEESTRNVRKRYGIEDGQKIVLYAPTYHEGEVYQRLDMRRVREHLERLTRQRWTCLVRTHRYESEEEKAWQTDGRIQNAAGYPDMQELLAAADMLITDYSSCIWDYSFLCRPCYLYVPDLEQYRKIRGFYVDITKWRFPFAQNEEELLKRISENDKTDWKKLAEKHHKDLGSFETGRASEKVAEYIRKECGQHFVPHGVERIKNGRKDK